LVLGARAAGRARTIIAREHAEEDGRAEEAQVRHAGDRSTDRAFKPVETDAVRRRVVRFPRAGALQRVAAGARGIRDHARLRVGELNAECACRDGRLFDGVRPEVDARRAAVRAPDWRAIDVDVRLTGPA